MSDGTNHFLAIANHNNGAAYNTQSFVLKWNPALGTSGIQEKAYQSGRVSI